MKSHKITILFLIFQLAVNCSLSQTTEIIYLDVLNDPSKDGGTSYAFKSKLLTDGNKSAFFHKSIDTVLANTSAGISEFPEGSKFHLRYLKNLKTSVVSYRKRSGRDVSSIIDTVSFDYKYGKETKIILGYNCKQAFLSWRGRYLEIFYTTKIHLKDGPFKFHGLPGLILSVKDPQGTVFIEAKSITFNTQEPIPSKLENFKSPISYKDFVNKYNKFREQLVNKIEAEEPGTYVNLPYKEIEIIHPDFIN